jgi:hypothetical protein
MNKKQIHIIHIKEKKKIKKKIKAEQWMINCMQTYDTHHLELIL